MTKPFYKRKRVIIPSVFVGLLIIGAASGGSDKPSEATTTTTALPDHVEVTLDEYNAIQTGMTLAQVETTFGGPGHSNTTSEVMGHKFETISWDGDGLGDTVIVSFEDGKVGTKSQFGLG